MNYITKRFRKTSNIGVNTFLNNPWIKEDLIREFKTYFELNENENITYHNLLDSTKAVLSGKFIAVNVYVRQEEKNLK